MLRFREIETIKDNFYASKKPINFWNVNFYNIVMSKLVKTKTSSNYLIGIKFHEAIRPLVFIMPKMNEYAKTFKFKGEDCKISRKSQNQ